MKVSIITVCKNSEKTIEATILSVLSQCYSPIEYIIVDGGSTDGTLAIIARYRDRIVDVISEPDRGIYDAMNKGIARSTGAIIGFLNADDLYATPNAIALVVRNIVRAKAAGSYGDLLYFSSTSGKTVRYWRGGAYRPGAFSRGWNPPHPTFFVRREWYAQWGGFDLSYTMGNDIELMMRLIEKKKMPVVYIPQLLVKMRLGGVSNRGIKNIVSQNKNIIQAAKKLGIPFFVPLFIIGKIVNRLMQFVVRPRSTDLNVTNVNG